MSDLTKVADLSRTLADPNAEPDAAEYGEARDSIFGAAVGRLGPVLLGSLRALEQVFRRLHPPDIPGLIGRVTPIRDALVLALADFSAVSAPEPLEKFAARLERAARLAVEALAGIVDPGPPEEAAIRAICAMHQHARAQAEVYPLRDALRPVSAYFAEPSLHDRLDELEAREDATARVGLFRSGELDARGGFDLYVPESYDGREAWPLVIALHGGSGNGADFLWTWLREARSRKFLVLSPTSRGSTWSLGTPLVDGDVMRRMTEWVMSNWNVDAKHVLLSGLSDGATMTLLVGLSADMPFTHLAPISGVLHPMNLAIGNLDRARDRPIYLVHGALDWLFPVTLAQEAAQVLKEAGADLVYREVEDLSHTYPREENVRIIAWFDSRRDETSVPPLD